MTSEKKQSSHIPIRFVDDNESDGECQVEDIAADADVIDLNDTQSNPDDSTTEVPESNADDNRGEGVLVGGPDLAELIASRAELKRLQTVLAEARDAVARRQADFENYRKRTERDRGETHNRIVADVARKLLPVVDNLARALEAEQSIETQESNEFRHFLHGVELINKQLNDVLESLGVQPIVAVGEPFDPHIHEAVVTEPSDKYEPDTVTEELARGYRMGERLLRPSMVKVAARDDQ
jgi:molecular chaperone GrpE